jgi:hypothetical protein
MSDSIASAPSASAPTPSSTPSSSSSAVGTSSPSTVSSSNPPSFQKPRESGENLGERPGGEKGRTENLPSPDSAIETKDGQTAESPRRVQVQVDGETFEVDEAELVKGYQRARASAKRFEEASKLQKTAQRVLEALQSDPMSILSHPSLGINAREVAERYLLSQIENEMLTPEQRQAKAEREELDRYRNEQRERAEAEKKAHFENLKGQYASQYERQFTEVMDKTGVPKTAETVARMAKYLRQAVANGHEPDLYDVAELVKEDIAAEQRAVYGSLEGDKLLQILGDDVAEKVRKAQLAKLQGAPGIPSHAPQAPQSRPVDDTPKRMNEHEWREAMRRKWTS